MFFLDHILFQLCSRFPTFKYNLDSLPLSIICFRAYVDGVVATFMFLQPLILVKNLHRLQIMMHATKRMYLNASIVNVTDVYMRRSYCQNPMYNITFRPGTALIAEHLRNMYALYSLQTGQEV